MQTGIADGLHGDDRVDEKVIVYQAMGCGGILESGKDGFGDGEFSDAGSRRGGSGVVVRGVWDEAGKDRSICLKEL